VPPCSGDLCRLGSDSVSLGWGPHEKERKTDEGEALEHRQARKEVSGGWEEGRKNAFVHHQKGSALVEDSVKP